MNALITKLAVASGLALALSACATLDTLAANGGTAEANRLKEVHAGLTQEEVRDLAGRPQNITGASRSGEELWIYDYIDAWGYTTDFNVTFDASGVVTGVYSQREEY
jgi:hypothetical protein